MSTDVTEWSLGVIGPGRVGTALAVALADRGTSAVAVAGRPSRDGRSASVERFLAAVPHAVALSADDVAAQCELILLTVGDDGLGPVARRLAAADVVRPGSRWLHTSGRHGTAVLRPLAAAGARTAACHPAQTFPTPALGGSALPGVAWAVTAALPDRGWARAFVTALDGTAVDVREEDRIRYHAALSVGSNGTAAVVSLARDLLLAAGVATPEAFLEPLTTRSAANAAAHGAGALTGPVRRGDVETVDAHLADLRAVLPEAVPAYRALAALALSYARRAGLDEARAHAIRTLLETDP